MKAFKRLDILNYSEEKDKYVYFVCFAACYIKTK